MYREYLFKQNVSIRKRVIAHINQKLDIAEAEAEKEIRDLHATCVEKKAKLDELLQEESESVLDRHVKQILNLWPTKN